VPTFALTIYHSLSLSLQTQNRSHSQILSSIVFLALFGLPSQILDLDCTQRGTGICFSFFFLLLARYVPNVAREEYMRSIKVSIYWRPTDQRPTGDRPLISKISNGHISATGSPIHSMFGSRVGFSGTAYLMALFPVRKYPRWRPPPSWKNFKWPYLRNRSSDPLHVWF